MSPGGGSAFGRRRPAWRASGVRVRARSGRTPGVRSLAAGPKIVTAAFLVSGVVHLVRPAVFEAIVPRALPHKRELVYASGLAELACAVGLLVPRSRRFAGR